MSTCCRMGLVAVSALGCGAQPQGFADGIAQALLGATRLRAVGKEPLRGTLLGCLRQPFAVQFLGELMELQHRLHPRFLPAGFRVASGLGDHHTCPPTGDPQDGDAGAFVAVGRDRDSCGLTPPGSRPAFRRRCRSRPGLYA